MVKLIFIEKKKKKKEKTTQIFVSKVDEE